MAEAVGDGLPKLIPSGSLDWQKSVLASLGSLTPKDVKGKYLGFVQEVALANPDLPPVQAWERVQEMQTKHDYRFFGVTYSDEPARQMVVQRNRMQALQELHLLKDDELPKLTQLETKFGTAISEVAEKTGDEPADVAKQIDSVILYGIAKNMDEAKAILIEGPIITGFEETVDPALTNEGMLHFLKDTFGAKQLRMAKVGSVQKDDKFLIYRGYNDKDILEGNDLMEKGLAHWDGGFLLADTRDNFIKAEMVLEGVDDPAKLRHIHKIRASAGDTLGFHTINLHSFGVEKSADFDYLATIPLTTETEKMRAYVLGTVTHEVAHRYYPLLTPENLGTYAEIVSSETIPSRTKYVSDYVLRHEEVYGTKQDTLINEDIAESVRILVTNPDYLQKNFPKRYAFIKEHFPFVREGAVVEYAKESDITVPNKKEVNSRQKLERFGSRDTVPVNPENTNVVYHGVEIEGLREFVDKKILTQEQVTTLLDQLPAEYFDMVKLGKIKFDSRKHFTVMRDNQVVLVSENEMLESDTVLRRVRAKTQWNSEMENGFHVASDGKQTITIYSTENWEGENQTDVALYSLAHELGHVTWNAIDPKQGPVFWEDLIKRGKISPFEIRTKQLANVITEWNKLPESTLPRYITYKSDFLREQNRGEGFAEQTIEHVSRQEDFAVSHEYMLYWKDLSTRDPSRYDILSMTYELIPELAKK